MTLTPRKLYLSQLTPNLSSNDSLFLATSEVNSAKSSQSSKGPRGSRCYWCSGGTVEGPLSSSRPALLSPSCPQGRAGAILGNTGLSPQAADPQRDVGCMREADSCMWPLMVLNCGGELETKLPKLSWRRGSWRICVWEQGCWIFRKLDAKVLKRKTHKSFHCHPLSCSTTF